MMSSVSTSENNDAYGLDVDNNVSEVVVSDLKENNDTSASHVVEHNNNYENGYKITCYLKKID